MCATVAARSPISWIICFSIFCRTKVSFKRIWFSFTGIFDLSISAAQHHMAMNSPNKSYWVFYVLHLTENPLPGGNNTPQKSQVLHSWTKTSSRCSVTQLLHKRRSPDGAHRLLPPLCLSSSRSFRFLLSFQGRYGTQPLSTRSRHTCTSPPYRQSWRLTSPFTSRPALLLECSWRTRASRTSSESSLAVSARCVCSVRGAIHTNYKQEQLSHNWETLC